MIKESMRISNQIGQHREFATDRSMIGERTMGKKGAGSAVSKPSQEIF